MKKGYLCVLLTAFVLLTSVFALPAVAANETVTYTESFQYEGSSVDAADLMLETAQWRLEESAISQGGVNGTKPEVKDGTLVLSKGNSVMFDWLEVSGIGTYDSTKTYTFGFDFSVSGEDSATASNGAREFYFAPGGYFNQIEAKDGKLRAGDDSGITWVEHALDTTYHAEVVWTGTTITSTVTDSTGTVVKTGSRTNSSYTNMTSNKEAMTHWAFRCEDACVTMDNFSFTDGTVTFTDSFDYGSSRVASMLHKDYWNVEHVDYTYGVSANAIFAEPTVEDSALYLKEGESVAFTWTKIPGMGAFDTTKTYTCEFDVTVTSDGDDGSLYDNASWVREFFVAPGGWFNQIEFKDGQLRAGGTGASGELGAYNLNEQYHVKIEWSNDTITSTVTDSAENVVKSGSRTNSGYADMTANEGCMNHWIFRCEDGESKMDNFSFTDGTTTFTDSFDYVAAASGTVVDAFLATDLWDLETGDLPGKLNCNEPALENGKMILSERDGVTFNWNNIPDMPVFDETTVYTIEFDVELLEYEGDSGWILSRELFVGPGGYYNQLEFLNGGVRTGYNGVYAEFDTTQPVHAKIVWKGDTITTTAYDTDGNVINTGARTNAAYTDMSANSNTMQRWALRCEDGSVAISNFTFSAKPQVFETQTFSVDSTKNNVVYSADVTVADSETAALSFNGGDLIEFSLGTMKISGSVAGTYPADTYHVELALNFAQKNALVTVTLPDGGIVRRGDNQLLGDAVSASEIIFSKTGNCSIANETVSYPEVTVRSYTLPSAPEKTEFEAKAYNLTSSFDSDGKTTRSFAWTAVTDFDNMAVVYAKADEFEDAANRITVTAEKEAPEEEANQSVLFYKADITGLEAGTEYTYMIGDITDDAWGNPYTFQTEGENETEFSFITLSDTQSTTWDGYRYAKAALDMALKEAPDAKFLLHGGDVVENGSTESMWNSFFDAMKGTVETLPMFATIGNHDTLGTDESSDLLFDLHFNHPNNGGRVALAGLTPEDVSGTAAKNLLKNPDETIYSFDYGNVHVVVLNSGAFNSTDEDNQILEAQRAWLEEDLANSNATWTIGLMHQGVYHRYNTGWYCNALQDVLEDNGVDLIFNGHEHLVKRTYAIKDAKIVSKENPDVITKGTGTVYSTVGSTVTSHDHLASSVEECLMVNGVDSTQAAYTVVDVSEDKLSVTIKTLNGLVIDRFTIVNDTMQIADVTVDGETATVGTLTAGTEATVHFNYRSETGADQAYTVMAAYYNADNELITAQSIASGTATDSADYALKFTVPEVANVDKIKFFAWDSVTNAIPLAKALEIRK